MTEAVAVRTPSGGSSSSKSCTGTGQFSLNLDTWRIAIFIILIIVFITGCFLMSTFSNLANNVAAQNECQFTATDIASISSIAATITTISGSFLYVIIVDSFPSGTAIHKMVMPVLCIILTALLFTIQGKIKSKDKACSTSISGFSSIQTLITWLQIGTGFLALIAGIQFLSKKKK